MICIKNEIFFTINYMSCMSTSPQEPYKKKRLYLNTCGYLKACKLVKELRFNELAMIVFMVFIITSLDIIEAIKKS